MEYIARRSFRNKPPLSVPSGLDPDRHPIILQHFFGIDPAELRLQRQAECLHALGPTGDHRALPYARQDVAASWENGCIRSLIVSKAGRIGQAQW